MAEEPVLPLHVYDVMLKSDSIINDPDKVTENPQEDSPSDYLHV